MPPKKQPTIWPAEPHTIAKVAILERYLNIWFQIMGRTVAGKDILVVDGFAGPGRYTNHATGSPVAVLRAAGKALEASGENWIAGEIHCAFIEKDRVRFEHLEAHLEPFSYDPRLNIHLFRSSFIDGMSTLREDMPQFFLTSAPMFVFIDPFGATGSPFATVVDILNSPRSEVLINFDADAIVRLFMAGSDAGHDRHLTEIYGDGSWRALLDEEKDFKKGWRTALALYKARLRSLPNINFVFSFEMGKTHGVLDYFLIFASQHHKGLEKMKEAMAGIDQDGEYRFYDSHANNPALFRFDQPDVYAPKLFQHFSGRQSTYKEVNDYALNETPFRNPKKMLGYLEKQGLVTVISTNPKRRRGTFEEKSTKLLMFGSGSPDG